MFCVTSFFVLVILWCFHFLFIVVWQYFVHCKKNWGQTSQPKIKYNSFNLCFVQRIVNDDVSNCFYNYKFKKIKRLKETSYVLRTSKTTVQSKTRILHRQPVQDSCQRVRVLSQFFPLFLSSLYSRTSIVSIK